MNQQDLPDSDKTNANRQSTRSRPDRPTVSQTENDSPVMRSQQSSEPVINPSNTAVILPGSYGELIYLPMTASTSLPIRRI